MYEVSRDDVFSASHHLRDYHGKCEAVHGHNWKVRLSVEGRELGPGGMLVDFVVLKKVLAEVLDALDHKDLNVVPPFDVMEPTAENLARHVFQEAAGRLDAPGRRVCRVQVWETDFSCATYY